MEYLGTSTEQIPRVEVAKYKNTNLSLYSHLFSNILQHSGRKSRYRPGLRIQPRGVLRILRHLWRHLAASGVFKREERWRRFCCRSLYICFDTPPRDGVDSGGRSYRPWARAFSFINMIIALIHLMLVQHTIINIAFLPSIIWPIRSVMWPIILRVLLRGTNDKTTTILCPWFKMPVQVLTCGWAVYKRAPSLLDLLKIEIYWNIHKVTRKQWFMISFYWHKHTMEG